MRLGLVGDGATAARWAAGGVCLVALVCSCGCLCAALGCLCGAYGVPIAWHVMTLCVCLAVRANLFQKTFRSINPRNVGVFVSDWWVAGAFTAPSACA